MSSRLFSEERLAELSAPPLVRLAGFLRAGEWETLEREASGLDGAFLRMVERYHEWLGATTKFICDRYGLVGATRVQPIVRQVYANHPVGDGRFTTTLADVAAKARSRDAREEDIIVAFAQTLESWERAVDFGRDLESAVLSYVYRHHGVDELEAVLRFIAEAIFVDGMEADLERTVEERILNAVVSTHAHSARFTIAEDAEKFTLVMDPCGTCTRQILDGRYGPPLDLAVVKEEHAITWGHGNVPIYRTHVAVMHDIVPRERFGFPLPVVECPMGSGTGPCRVLIYKDLGRPSASI
jgi:hypothetical protein